MLAVIQTGGKQYAVKTGDVAVVEKLKNQIGDKVIFESLLTQEKKCSVQTFVSAEVIAHTKNKKILVFKKKRRKNYRRLQGHRQNQTVLKILSISNDLSTLNESVQVLQNPPHSDESSITMEGENGA